MTTIKVQFHWATYRPDARQYKQQSLEVNPFLPEGNQPLVEIELPVELLANAEAYLLAGVEGNKSPTPILSVKGVKYLVDQWESVFSDPKEVELDDFAPAFNEDVEWKNDPRLKPVSAKTNATDNWDDGPRKAVAAASGDPDPENENWEDVTTTEEPIPWNEKDEDWGTEPNFDN